MRRPRSIPSLIGALAVTPLVLAVAWRHTAAPSSSSDSTAPNADSAAPSRYETQLQPLIEDLVRRQQIPGLTIAIVQRGKIAYTHAFGVRDLRRPAAPVTTRSLFHTASITKTFVATAVVQLADAKKVDLDAAVARYLPYFRIADSRGSSLTLRQMLTHTSGMPDVDDYEWDKPQYDDGALERYVRSLSDQHLVSAPGAEYHYSNMAYEVLGDVIAKASGESFEDYVQRHILTPLGMASSTVYLTGADTTLLTWGHVLDINGDPVPEKDFPYNRMHSPSSDLHSNVLDLARWAMANMRHGELDGRRILPVSAYDQLWKPAHRGFGEHWVGLSWFLGTYRHQRTISHDGGDIGYVADLVMLPDRQIAVTWLANCDWISLDLTHAALDVALGVAPKPLDIHRSVAGAMYGTLAAGKLDSANVDAAIAQFHTLRSKDSTLYQVSESGMNRLGAWLLDQHKPAAAARVLRLNVESFPLSPNAHAELAAASLAAGDTSAAIAAYEAALKLDPTLASARAALAQLQLSR